MFQNRFLRYSENFYQIFIQLGSNLQSLLLLYLRVTWGHQFAIDGLLKLQKIEATIATFTTLQISHPWISAHLAGWVELIFGFCIFIGFGSRFVALPLISLMFNALKISKGPDVPALNLLLDPMLLVKEPPYPFLLAAVIIFCFGPGRISIDAWLKRWAEKKPRF